MSVKNRPIEIDNCCLPSDKPSCGFPQIAEFHWAAYISIARPDNWFKNVFMLAGVALAAFCHPELIGWCAVRTICRAIAVTCIVASSNYVINEILDAPTDLHHPVKRHRPIPSGLVNVRWAYLEWILLGLLGMALAATINRWFFWSSVALLVMGLIYNIPPVRSKELPYVDVLSESVNNPLRLLLGWFAVSAVDVPPLTITLSYWMAGAFFMAAKRFAEYRSIGSSATAGAYRKSFQHYTQENLLVSMFFYATAAALFLGVFIIRYHLELILSVPLLAGFFAFYLHVALKKDSVAQAPERLHREYGLMGYLVLCVGVFVLLMFVQIPALYDIFNVPSSGTTVLWRF
jgi:4-hydroxybenzoate polyprenyltransferase